jgi:hypothetical protein
MQRTWAQTCKVGLPDLNHVAVGNSAVSENNFLLSIEAGLFEPTRNEKESLFGLKRRHHAILPGCIAISF